VPLVLDFGAGEDVTPLRADIRAELRAAEREVARAYDGLPPAVRARVELAARDGLDAEVSAATAAGDSERALAAVRAWRTWWLHEFADATQRQRRKVRT
jgi:hypothetical protein